MSAKRVTYSKFERGCSGQIRPSVVSEGVSVDINQSVIQISNLRSDIAVPDPGFAVGGTRVAPCSISCWQCLPGYVHSSDPEPISLLRSSRSGSKWPYSSGNGHDRH